MFDKNKMEIFKLNHKQSSRITAIHLTGDIPESYRLIQ